MFRFRRNAAWTRLHRALAPLHGRFSRFSGENPSKDGFFSSLRFLLNHVKTPMSILHVSPLPTRPVYPPGMADWELWGKRFRALIKDRGLTLGTLSGKLDMSESGLRSWVNGNREINLADFFRLCKAASIDPSQVLFGSVRISEEQRKQLGQIVGAILDSDPSSQPGYAPAVEKLRKDIKKRTTQ